MNTLIGMPEPATVNLVEPTPSQTLWNGRLYWITAPVIVTLILIATVVGTIRLTDNDNRLGTMPDQFWRSVEVNRNAGEFSIQAMYIEAPGDDVTILNVTPLTSANVEYLGAVAIWPRDFPTEWQVTGPGFPQKRVKVHHPIHETIPATETAFREQGDVQWDVTIEAGFRLVSGEIGAVNGIQITYKVGDRVMREVFKRATLACFDMNVCNGDFGVAGGREELLDEMGLLYS
jgi:hypothetical protein